jgi:tetratricopeptide (TPR) repeat protein
VASDIPGGPAGELGRPADALAAFQQVIDRYGEDPAPALRERVAAALGNQGAMFSNLGRFAEALAAYQQVIDRYGEDPAPALREWVEKATTSSSDIRGRREI